MAASPKVLTNRAADTSAVIAPSQSTVSLTSGAPMSGKPTFAPQVVDLVNLNSAAAVAFTIVPEDGVSQSISVPQNCVYRYTTPVITITTPALGQAVCYWWERGVPIGLGQFTPPSRNP